MLTASAKGELLPGRDISVAPRVELPTAFSDVGNCIRMHLVARPNLGLSLMRVQRRQPPFQP